MHQQVLIYINKIFVQIINKPIVNWIELALEILYSVLKKEKKAHHYLRQRVWLSHASPDPDRSALLIRAAIVIAMANGNWCFIRLWLPSAMSIIMASNTANWLTWSKGKQWWWERERESNQALSPPLANPILLLDWDVLCRDLEKERERTK